MRQQLRPAVERLDSRTLLSGLVIPAVGPSGFRLPSVNLTPITVPAGGALGQVSLTLTTDRSVYQVGQPVNMTLTEKNIGKGDILISDGPSVNGFFVTQSGQTIWRSNAGFQPFFIRLIDLAPGQSYTLKATWDGHPNNAFGGGELSATPTGTFVVSTQVQQSGATAAPVAITIVNPSPPAPTPATTPNTSQPLVVSVATNRATSTVGQPLTVTLTETNTSNHDVPVGNVSPDFFASVTGPKGPLWLGLAPDGKGVLHAGQSRKFTLVWNGAPNLPGAIPAAGTYVVQAGVDGVTGQATVVVHS
jgi:hypothetical protein